MTDRELQIARLIVKFEHASFMAGMAHQKDLEASPADLPVTTKVRTDAIIKAEQAKDELYQALGIPRG